MANGKVTYRTLNKVGVQEGRGGIGLASVRQKTDHRKENLRRRTDPGLDRETYAAGMAQRRQGRVHIRRVGEESLERLRERRFCSQTARWVYP